MARRVTAGRVTAAERRGCRKAAGSLHDFWFNELMALENAGQYVDEGIESDLSPEPLAAPELRRIHAACTLSSTPLSTAPCRAVTRSMQEMGASLLEGTVTASRFPRLRPTSEAAWALVEWGPLIAGLRASPPGGAVEERARLSVLLMAVEDSVLEIRSKHAGTEVPPGGERAHAQARWAYESLLAETHRQMYPGKEPPPAGVQLSSLEALLRGRREAFQACFFPGNAAAQLQGCR